MMPPDISSQVQADAPLVASKRIFFVCGCPRSGTTALWRLLYEHPDTLITQERYFRLVVVAKARLSEEHFKRDRFLTIQPDDTYYDQAEFENKHRDIARKYDQATLIGDKIPPLFNRYDMIKRNFTDVRLVFVFRNIFDVAVSYNNRANNVDDRFWDRNRRSEAAVQEWNHSLATTRRALTSMDILLLQYESFFRSEGHLKLVTSFLDLDVDEGFAEQFCKLTRNYVNHFEKRDRDGLSAREKNHLLNHADFRTFRRFSRQYQEQLDAL